MTKSTRRARAKGTQRHEKAHQGARQEARQEAHQENRTRRKFMHFRERSKRERESTKTRKREKREHAKTERCDRAHQEARASAPEAHSKQTRTMRIISEKIFRMRRAKRSSQDVRWKPGTRASFPWKPGSDWTWAISSACLRRSCSPPLEPSLRRQARSKIPS